MPNDVAVGLRCSSIDIDHEECMGSILMQDAFFSAVTEGRVDPAFHPSGVGEMGILCIHRGNPGMCIREQ